MKFTREEILEHRQQWVAALRSNGYEQCRGHLVRATDDGREYCCLGVASELAGLEVVEHSDGELAFKGRGWWGGLGLTFSVLGVDAQEWLGVNHDMPELDIPRSYKFEPIDSGLAALNDTGLTFAQIADMIEYFGFHPNSDALADSERVNNV